MTGDEVGKLLGLMALADNRKPPKDEEGRKAMIAFWLSMVGDLAYTDAAQAVHEHYQESRDWIMPADIRQRVRRIRDARLKAVPEPVPPPELLEDADAYREWLRKETKRIADGKPDLRAIGGAS
jgi:hypothetical protein